ncbi:MAG: STAS/SEC14 domain-containing protein [Robiginitomaculum sp.]|nr:STAS/SEC14 domain-containing protein [Robiginitomaculum sp.]
MIEVLANTDVKVLAFRVSDKLTAEDYETVLIPKIEERIKRDGKVRLLLEWGEHFEGWQTKAIIDDAKLCFAHWNHFERWALVGAPKWVGVSAKLFDKVSKGKVKLFDAGEVDQALAWASA